MMRFGMVLSGIFMVIFLSSCASKMIPAEDIDVYEVCRGEIKILRNPRIPANSKEKFDAALSMISKVDFSYTRTLDFLGRIFSETDAKMEPSGEGIVVIVYYPYEDKYVSFEFYILQRSVYKTVVKYKK